MPGVLDFEFPGIGGVALIPGPPPRDLHTLQMKVTPDQFASAYEALVQDVFAHDDRKLLVSLHPARSRWLAAHCNRMSESGWMIARGNAPRAFKGSATSDPGGCAADFRRGGRGGLGQRHEDSAQDAPDGQRDAHNHPGHRLRPPPASVPGTALWRQCGHSRAPRCASQCASAWLDARPIERG